MQNEECRVQNEKVSNWSRWRDSHSRGANARQFTKLLLSLLSHIGAVNSFCILHLELVGRHGTAPCSAV